MAVTACLAQEVPSWPTGPGGGTFVTPSGAVISFGSSCKGSEYFVDGDGWAVCYDGVWGYTTDDPSALCGGWPPEFVDAGSDSSVADASSDTPDSVIAESATDSSDALSDAGG
jgi:hypothetical protein